MRYNVIPVIKKLALVVPVVLACTVGWLYLMRANAVVYRYSDHGAVEYNSFIILNPFRDREPESQAERILSGLKDGTCETTLLLPEMARDSIDYLCQKEGFYPLISWNLIDRKDTGPQTTLIFSDYRCDRGDTIPEGKEIYSGGTITIEVKKTGDSWSVVSYDTYY